MTTHNKIRRGTLAAAVVLSVIPWAIACSPGQPELTQVGAALMDPGMAQVSIVTSAQTGPADPFEVTAYRLGGDTLHVDVSYSGGCATHQFMGLVESAVMESYPVQMSGRIAHDGRNDPCDAVVSGSITLDLTPVREYYQGLYGSAPASIWLTLSPLAERLLYSF